MIYRHVDVNLYSIGGFDLVSLHHVVNSLFLYLFNHADAVLQYRIEKSHSMPPHPLQQQITCIMPLLFFCWL